METINYPITDPGGTTIVAQTDNDFVLTSFEPYIDRPEDWRPSSVVVEDTDETGYATCAANWDTVARMLWLLLEEMGLVTNRTDPKTIDIKVIDQ